MTYYLAPDFPEEAVKPTTIFFYATEGKEAAALALKEREAHRTGYSRDATAFDGETEPCTRVIIMGSVKRFHRAKIEEAYGDLVEDIGGASPASDVAGQVNAQTNTPENAEAIGQAVKATMVQVVEERLARRAGQADAPPAEDTLKQENGEATVGISNIVCEKPEGWDEVASANSRALNEDMATRKSLVEPQRAPQRRAKLALPSGNLV